MTTIAKKEKEISVSFQLKSIELLEACLNHPKHLNADLKVFHFDIKIGHKLDTDNKMFIALIDIGLFNELRELKLGSLTAHCIFEIENMIDFMDTKTKKINLPDEFIITMNSITISTARGIMFNQFKGTFLHNAILPIVNPGSFVMQKKEMGSVPISKHNGD
jgi:hypothetical protein